MATQLYEHPKQGQKEQYDVSKQDGKPQTLSLGLSCHQLRLNVVTGKEGEQRTVKPPASLTECPWVCGFCLMGVCVKTHGAYECLYKVRELKWFIFQQRRQPTERYPVLRKDQI